MTRMLTTATSTTSLHSAVPEGWSVEQIRGFATIGTGARDTQDRSASGRYPFFVRSQKVERIDSWSFDGEAVLTAGDGVGTGKVFHYINGRFDYHQRVYRISYFRSDVSGKFFFYQFSQNFLARIESLTAKSSVDSVRMETIAGMDIALPGRAEQDRIVEAIDDADELVCSLERLIAKKQAIRRGMMRSLLSRDTHTPGFSARWSEIRLADLADIRKGQQLSRKDMQLAGRYAVWNGGISPSGMTDTPNCGGGITISEGGNSCGFVGRVPGPFWLGGHCYLVTPGASAFDESFVYHCLKYREAGIMGLRVGSGLPNIQRGRLSEFRVAVPKDRDEQSRVAGILDAADIELVRLGDLLGKHVAIKQGMMQELLTGRTRLRVKEPAA